jgi:hypothetical protein
MRAIRIPQRTSRIALLAFAFGLVLSATAASKPPLSLPADAAWQKLQTEPYKGKQDDIHFIDANRGWYVNGAGKIFATSNNRDTHKPEIPYSHLRHFPTANSLPPGLRCQPWPSRDHSSFQPIPHAHSIACIAACGARSCAVSTITPVSRSSTANIGCRTGSRWLLHASQPMCLPMR